jgi:hypothetical protein
MSKSTRTVRNFILIPALFAMAISGQQGQTCDPQIQQAAVNQCTAGCADIGECIFGCEIGGIGQTDICNQSCEGLGDACLNSCNSVVTQITSQCTGTSNVTASVSLKLGTVVLNRATGIWQQTVVVSNTTNAAMNGLGYILDSLNPGWTLTNGDGVTTQLPPTSSSYKNFGPLGPNSAATVTLQFTRTGTPAFTYSPRVLSGSAR